MLYLINSHQSSKVTSSILSKKNIFVAPSKDKKNGNRSSLGEPPPVHLDPDETAQLGSKNDDLFNQLITTKKSDTNWKIDVHKFYFPIVGVFSQL